MKCKMLMLDKVLFSKNQTPPQKMEDEINNWLGNNSNIKIKFLTQTIFPSGTSVTSIFYEE